MAGRLHNSDRCEPFQPCSIPSAVPQPQHFQAIQEGTSLQTVHSRGCQSVSAEQWQQFLQLPLPSWQRQHTHPEPSRVVPHLPPFKWPQVWTQSVGVTALLYHHASFPLLHITKGLHW